MAKKVKQYQITKTKYISNQHYKSNIGSVAELVEYYRYTLETGRSYQHEKGNKKINCNPTTIKSLVSNLNNAVNNAAANGYAGVTFTYEELTQVVETV